MNFQLTPDSGCSIPQFEIRNRPFPLSPLRFSPFIADNNLQKEQR